MKVVGFLLVQFVQESKLIWKKKGGIETQIVVEENSYGTEVNFST